MRLKVSLFVCFILLCLSGASQDIDSLSWSSVHHTVNDDLVEELRSSKEYEYIYLENKEPNFFGKLWQSFLNYLNKAFSLSSNTVGSLAAKIALMILGMMLLVWVLTKMNANRLIGKSNRKIEFTLQDGSLIDSDMNFDQLLSESVQQGNYKKAIQIVYIKSILYLGNKKIISPQKFKSNAKYISEIEDEKVKITFSELTEAFEYVHFGEFETDEGLYLDVKQKFDNLQELTL